MDRKSVIILIVCGLLFFLWAWLVPQLYPPVPLPKRTNQTAAFSATNVSAAEISAPTNTPAIPPAAVQVAPTAAEEFLVEENAKARYTFTSYGGALKVVELKDYPE